MSRFLVAGDVHGNLDGLFEIADEVEKRHGILDGILQAGDMGFFLPDSVLDSATKSFLKKDPSETGCMPYAAGVKKAPREIWFARGNHEDHEYLLHCGYSADPHQMIHCLKDGSVTDLFGLRVGAVGGIEYMGQNPNKEKNLKFFNDKPFDALKASGTEMDIFLGHDGPMGFGSAQDSLIGSIKIKELLEGLAHPPKFVFFGHYGHPARPGKIGDTWVVPLNQPDVLVIPRRDGGCGILETSPLVFRFLMPDYSLRGLDGLPS